MNYQSSLEFLFQALPMFQRVGASAFKKDLSNTLKLCEHLGNPQNKFKSIHIAGTNGKGSTAHALGSVLQEAGYVTGLYTSPHLKSFRERIKINGIEIPESEIVNFVKAHKDYLLELKPSFFEMTVALSFDYFAGIIKEKVPVIIGQSQAATTEVFQNKALEKEAPITFADQSIHARFNGYSEDSDGKNRVVYEIEGTSSYIKKVHLDLLGNYQSKNLPGILASINILKSQGLLIDQKQLFAGLANIVANTGLKGRWQTLSTDPLTICDTGHNIDGIQDIVAQLLTLKNDQQLYMVLGMVKDKAHDKVFEKLPKEARYVFCEADQPRSMPAEALKNLAAGFGLKGTVVTEVNAALAYARGKAKPEDLIFIGGSTFVVAEINDL